MHLVRIQNITVWFQLLEVGILLLKQKKKREAFTFVSSATRYSSVRKNVFYLFICTFRRCLLSNKLGFV